MKTKLTRKQILVDPELKNAALEFGIIEILASQKMEPNNIQLRKDKNKRLYFKYTKGHPPITN
jgi:hypothetical protein